MNIELQCCGLVMLLVILVIIFREKSLNLSSRRMFVQTLCACIVCLAMDVLSVIAIVGATYGTFPRVPTLIICKLYLGFLIGQGYAGLLYVAGEFFADKTHRRIKRLYQIVSLVGLILILVLPIDYYCVGRVVYSYGPSTGATYGLAFLLFLSTILMAFIGKGTSRRRKRTVLIWQIGWLAAALLQFTHPQLLVVGFAAAFGLVIVYAELENSYEGIDRLTGQFTSSAMYTYLVDLYRQEKPFAAMQVSIDYRAAEADLQLEQTALRRLADVMDEGRNAYVFRQSDSDFVVIYPGADQMQASYRRVSAQMARQTDVPIKLYYTLIPDSSIFENVEEFLQYQYFISRSPSRSEYAVIGADQAQEMRDYRGMRDQISWAMENGRVEVFYQPIYDIASGRFASAEALVRIRDSEGGLVMPGRFIPVAEESGQIVPLGQEVFRQVCALLAEGIVQRLGIRYIEVNLSMAQFDEDNPASFVQEIMDRYGVDPGEINLEITETADANTRQAVIRNMERLIKSGVSFALDDFGTGRSNFDYFISMPVDIIKFDRSFTQGYFTDAKTRAVIEGVARTMHQMQLQIVAEGVETAEQLAGMKVLGVTSIQGFYFSRPLPKEEFLAFLADRQADAAE